jgi:peptidoglycan/LPS O-acetylase OafA/YrhL
MTKRSTAVDILRAAAVFLVLGRHMDLPSANNSSVLHSLARWFSETWMRGGWVGVDLFFVLSGFLVSGLLFREHQKFGTISGKDFLIRRGFKIYPAFWVLIGITSISMLIAHDFSAKIIFSELLFLQNYGPAAWMHTWSLAVEEHFYILLLLLLVFLSWRGSANPFRSIPRIFLAVAVASLFLRIVTSYAMPYYHKTHLFPSHLRMDSLFCGVVISYIYHYHSVRFLSTATRYRVAALVLGVGAMVPAFVFQLETTRFIYSWGLTLFYIGSGLILIASLTFKLPENKILKCAAYVGSHSYSIYLWHVPLAAWGLHLLARCLGQYATWSINCAFYLLGSVFLGIIMALAVEFPLLSLRDHWFPSRARPLRISATGTAIRPIRKAPVPVSEPLTTNAHHP